MIGDMHRYSVRERVDDDDDDGNGGRARVTEKTVASLDTSYKQAHVNR